MALCGAGAGALALAVVWLVALHLGVAERADQSIFRGFAGLRGGHVSSAARFVAQLCDPKPFVCFAAVIVLVALVRRQPSLAFAAAAIMLGASVTTQLLKPLLAEPRAHSLLGSAQVGPDSWPSGHATAAMSLALSAVLVAPPRARPAVAALGAAFAVAVSYSFLTLGWHYPSDALAGLLVASIWTLLGVAWLTVVDARRHRQVDRPAQLAVTKAVTPSLFVVCAAAVLACVAIAVRPEGVAAYARLHAAFIAGAAALGITALSVAAGVLLTIRR
jgi:PAP2 superfamily